MKVCCSVLHLGEESISLSCPPVRDMKHWSLCLAAEYTSSGTYKTRGKVLVLIAVWIFSFYTTSSCLNDL